MPARACQLTVKGFLTQAIPAAAPHLRPQESLRGTGKGSSCIHTAVCTKELWPPPPLAFPEPLQGSCSFTLPQRALTHALVLLPPAQGATTALLVPWKKRDLAQRLKFRLLGHQLSSYPSMLTFWCPRGLSEAAQLLLAEARRGWGHLLAFFFLRSLQMVAWEGVVKRMREEFKPTDLKSRSTPCS